MIGLRRCFKEILNDTQAFVFYMAMPFSISAGKLPAEM